MPAKFKKGDLVQIRKGGGLYYNDKLDYVGKITKVSKAFPLKTFCYFLEGLKYPVSEKRLKKVPE